MSLPLQVELPQYSISFTVELPPSSTVADAKLEIARVCPGNPRTDGQRLICKGRILSDTEPLAQVWKSADEARTVQLAVNPWAWPGLPPQTPASVQDSLNPTGMGSPAVPTAGTPTIGTPTVGTSTTSHTASTTWSGQFVDSRTSTRLNPIYQSNAWRLSYIIYLHNVAIRSLAKMAPLPQLPDLDRSKAYAQNILRNAGIPWPELFDKEFPPESADQGVKYELTTEFGLPFLQLTTPDATPSERQRHSLDVLTHTFALLPLSSQQLTGSHSSSSSTNQNGYTTDPATVPIDQDRIIAPQVRANPIPQPPPPPPAERQLPIRALLAPLILLCLRTALLLYLFAPVRKPVFGFLLGAWAMYEAWRAIRGALGQAGWGRRIAAGGLGVQGMQNGQPHLGGGPPAQDPALRARLQRAEGLSQEYVLNRLGQMNMDNETRYLTTPEIAPPEEPSVVQKAKLFVSLFFLTLNPAIWERRRAALRLREGTLRTEANMRQPSEAEEPEDRVQFRAQSRALHERRPEWLRRYTDRARTGEWPED